MSRPCDAQGSDGTRGRPPIPPCSADLPNRCHARSCGHPVDTVPAEAHGRRLLGPLPSHGLAVLAGDDSWGERASPPDTLLRSRERSPLRVDESLPSCKVLRVKRRGGGRSTERKPGSAKGRSAEHPPWRFWPSLSRQRAESPSPLTTRRGPVRPRGWGSRPTAGLAPVTGQAEPADYLASDHPTCSLRNRTPGATSSAPRK